MIDYADLLGVVGETLVAINPARVVTRTFRDFASRDELTELTPGIFTITFAGVRAYPADRCDQHDGDGPGATALPVFRFRITGQQFIPLPDADDGAALEAAEFSMLQDIERLADRLMSDHTLDHFEVLSRLTLQSVQTSEQLEAPYVWIAALFEASIT